MTWQKIRMSSNGFIVALWWTVKRFITAFCVSGAPNSKDQKIAGFASAYGGMVYRPVDGGAYHHVGAGKACDLLKLPTETGSRTPYFAVNVV
jgi:hypothetical protein